MTATMDSLNFMGIYSILLIEIGPPVKSKAWVFSGRESGDGPVGWDLAAPAVETPKHPPAGPIDPRPIRADIGRPGFSQESEDYFPALYPMGSFLNRPPVRIGSPL
jgi:hypothetical protein